MRRLGATTVLLFAGMTGAAAKEKNVVTIQVRALSYEQQVNEHRSTYVTPGHSNTTCSSTGTTIGNTTMANADCQTTSTPAQTHAIDSRTIDVTNFVESGGQRYKISCRASWVGSNCSALTQGDVFNAKIEGNTMWIYGRKGGNMGKEVKIKNRIWDIRPMVGQ